MTRNRVKPHPAMLALGAITLVLSAWGLFHLATVEAGMPAELAVLTIAGFDLFALAVAKHALTVAEDGDSSGPWNALVVVIAGLAAFLQYAHMTLTGRPWQVGILMAAFPVATVVLFEGTIRRAHRLNGRADGRVAPPRATFEILQWIFYRKATMHAFKLAVADRTLGADGAFKLGLLATENQPPAPPVQRRVIELDYAELLGLPAGSGQVSEQDSSQELRTVADAVRAVSGQCGNDLRRIVPAVRDLLADPTIPEDTIRRTHSRVSVNGRGPA